MDSVESAQAWREARQNVAARKPAPAGAQVSVGGAAGVSGSSAGGGSRAEAPSAVSGGFDGFFPRELPPVDMQPWPGGGGDAGREAVYGGDPAEDHQAARTRREIAEANLAEMREAEERRDLIRVSAVKVTLATVFATTRDALLQIPARLAPILAADADPANVQNTLHAEIHQALLHLAGASDRMGQTEGVLE